MNLAKEIKDKNLTMVVFLTAEPEDWVTALSGFAVETPQEHRQLALASLELADEMEGL